MFPSIQNKKNTSEFADSKLLVYKDYLNETGLSMIVISLETDPHEELRTCKLKNHVSSKLFNLPLCLHLIEIMHRPPS